MSRRADGEAMDRMVFDAVYSNRHVHKDTESALGADLIPVIDRRCLTRPKDLAYGQPHRVATSMGTRQPLPSRSFVLLGKPGEQDGSGRAVDF